MGLVYDLNQSGSKEKLFFATELVFRIKTNAAQSSGQSLLLLFKNSLVTVVRRRKHCEKTAAGCPFERSWFV
jgi:hypothetical protein